MGWLEDSNSSDPNWINSANPEVNKANDVGNCHRYARFMHRLSHSEAVLVFWLLFLFQIICLIGIVQLYDSVQEKYTEIINAEKDLQNKTQLEEMKTQVRKISKRCLAQTFFLFILLLFSTIMQVFAAHNIHFCHQKSLIHLYFPVWTVFAIGITFATLGCCVTQVYALKTMKLPPFGLALGTPVLVVSAVTHLVWNTLSEHKKRNQDVEDGLQPVLTQNTASIPFTVSTSQSVRSQSNSGNSTVSLANGPVIQIRTGTDPIPSGANAIGSTSQGYLTIEHIYLCSATSSESSASLDIERPIPISGRGRTPFPIEVSRQNSAIATRSITFEEPNQCCPGL